MGQTFSNVDAAILPWLLRNFLLVHYRCKKYGRKYGWMRG